MMEIQAPAAPVQPFAPRARTARMRTGAVVRLQPPATREAEAPMALAQRPVLRRRCRMRSVAEVHRRGPSAQAERPPWRR